MTASQSRAEEALAATCMWLREKKLTAQTLPIDFRDTGDQNRIFDSSNLVLGLPTDRARRKTKEDRDRLTKSWREQRGNNAKPIITGRVGELDALLHRKGYGLLLNFARLPVNAIAFYRPFHLEPVDRWGIYIFVDRLLAYARGVKARAPLFEGVSQELFLHLVLFEMFHHEFYHHLVESAATVMEILADANGSSFPGYLAYRHAVWYKKLTDHEHQPIEEALANAYAYNSLSFISRVKTGYRDAMVWHYQRALLPQWKTEGPGYRDAANYVDGNQTHGNAQLLAMILQRPYHSGLEQVASCVMPSGFSAFVGKPDIPTHLVGSTEDLKAFEDMVPAPNETYCNLFWPIDDSAASSALKARHEENQVRRREAMQAR